MRTTAATRPADYTAMAVATELERRGFTPGTAGRLMSIAAEFGIKAEVVPGGGVVTIQRAARGRYTIVNHMVLL